MNARLYLMVYDDEDPLARTDQITVPAAIWLRADRDHVGLGPIYVHIGGDVVGRLRPAIPSDGLGVDRCRVPLWMWVRMGAPIEEEGDDPWVELTVTGLPVAESIVLRARKEATLTECADPVEMLTKEISSGWATMTAGAELPLPCGTFDILAIRIAGGREVAGASVLDTDVNLELVPSVDSAPSPAPSPSPAPAPSPAPSPAPAYSPFPMIPHSLAPNGGSFTSFSGVGHRLG
jgi:hypothetical protein